MLLRLSICLILLASLVGCNKQEPSKAEAFKADQSATLTPHGKINLDSVQETDRGVSYETTDKTKWDVSMEKAADGQYRYGTPDRVGQAK
jgi:hypothetical protein